MEVIDFFAQMLCIASVVFMGRIIFFQVEQFTWKYQSVKQLSLPKGYLDLKSSYRAICPNKEEMADLNFIKSAVSNNWKVNVSILQLTTLVLMYLLGLFGVYYIDPQSSVPNVFIVLGTVSFTFFTISIIVLKVTEKLIFK